MKKAILFLMLLIPLVGSIKKDSKIKISIEKLLFLIGGIIMIFLVSLVIVGSVIEDTYVIELDDRVTDWIPTGIDPYLDEGLDSFILTTSGAESHGDFNFTDLPDDAISITSVDFNIYAECVGTAFRLLIHIWDSGASDYILHGDLGACGSAGWKTFSVPELTTVEEVNNAKFYVVSVCRIKAGCTGGSANASSAFLRVNYVGESTPPNITFVNPTPDDNSYVFNDYFTVNVSAEGDNNISTFIDFDSTLVSWWRMDDIDDSGNVTDYTNRFNGTPKLGAAQSGGVLGSGFGFDGTNFINITESDTGILQLDTTNFTMVMWAKKSDTTNAVLLGSREGNTGYVFFLNDDTNSLAFIMFGVFFGGPVLPIDDMLNWHQYAITYDHVNMSYYYDGALFNRTGLSVDLIPSGRTIYIGGNNKDTGFTTAFNGNMDDVLVFNRSLNETEIRGLYANKSSEYLAVDFTNLANGMHTFKAYTQDLRGNVNQTELRTVTIPCWTVFEGLITISIACPNVNGLIDISPILIDVNEFLE